MYLNRGAGDKSNVRIGGGQVVYYSKRARRGEAEYIDYGLSAFRREVIEARAAAALPLDLAAVLEDLVAQGRLAAFPVRQRFYEIGSTQGIADLASYLQEEAKRPE